MKIAAVGTALLALLLLVAFPSQAAVAVADLSEPVSISGQWHFQLGDDPGWSAVGFDDSRWQLTAVPGSAPEGHAGYGGMLWYRLTLELDLSRPELKRQVGALAVVIGQVQSAYEVYAGGVRLGGVGDLPPAARATYDRIETWAIPPEAVSDKGTLVLALRVWRDPELAASFETGPYGGDFLLGNVGDLRALMLQKALVPSVVLTALYLVLGLYHLLIARRNPSLTQFFWFGLFSMTLAGYTFETSQSKFFLELPFVWHKKLEYLLVYILPLLFSKMLLSATRTSENLVTRGFNLVFIVYFVVALVAPGIALLTKSLSSFQYTGAAWAVFMAGLMAWRAYQGSRSARGILVLLLIFIAALVNDIFLETALIGSGDVLSIVFALILLFMALMMAERYTEVLKQLETSVEERTAQLVDANAELEMALETKGQFLSTMSHEMRTPMNAVLGLTRLGLKTELTDQQRDYFGKVEQSAEDLQDIIETVLDFSKLEEGQLTCVSESFSLESVAEGLRRTWQDSAEQAGLEYRTTLDADIPERLVGDGKRLKQVLGNLLSNAIKFTEQGKVNLSIELAAQSGDAATVVFAVSDTGVGIGADQREQLFEAFSQADGSMTRQYGGAGMGLSIAQKLVGLMGGQIEVDSSPGEGSTFRFSLDLPVGETSPEGDEMSGELDLSAIRGASILLVDDSDLNLQVAGELLRQAKLYVDVAHDGSEAVDMVKAGQYDCVLMDVQMPVMDGYTATETIRALVEYQDLPIIAMTANALPQDRERGAEAGMNEYVPKPIEPEVLHRALLHWIAPGDRLYEEETVAEDGGVLIELPEQLPGVMVSAGLVRLGGNTGLYLELLDGLCKDYQDAPARLRDMLAADDGEGGRQLAHKLRGIANNLGAEQLGSCAETIELALKAGESPSGDALAELEAAIAVTVEARDSLAPLADTGASDEQISGENRDTLVGELLQAVADNNPEALDIVGQLLAGLPEDDGSFGTLSGARDALDMYDFASASQKLEGLQRGAG